MNWNISISYPWWFILLCLLVGVFYAGLLYFKSRDSDRFSENKWVLNLLAVLRFLLGSVLTFLLLGPVLKYTGFITQKPILAMVIDDSKSMIQGDVSKEQINTALGSLDKNLSEKYDVEWVAYSNVAQSTNISSLAYNGTETNYSQALRFVTDQYVNQNLGAVVLLSDGIFNAGTDPSYVAENYKVPIYTIGLGDTTVYVDCGVSNVSHNSIAYLGNEFPMQVELKASKLKGKQANLQVLLNGNTVEQKTVLVDKDVFYYETDIVAKTQRVGQNKIEVRVTQFDNEKNKDNNNYVFYVDVIDGKKKVAIWGSAPHPDLGMLRSAINSNENYSAQISVGPYEVSSDLDLVVLHDWFTSQSQLSLYEKLRSSGVPTLLICGDNFNGRLFNSGSQDLKFNTTGRGVNAALPLVNGNFEYFELESDVVSSVKKWPPLKAPFGKWKGYLPSDVLLFQQIGSVATKEPLVLLSANNKSRLGVVSGTGMWQWRLADYEQNENLDGVTSVVSKIVQYLAVKEEKKLLEVYASARQYGVGEDVTILGELYNQSLDPIAGQEINIQLTNSDGDVYKHTMSAVGNQYRLVLDKLEAGPYVFSASATVGGVKLKDKGYFTVVGQQKELIDLQANFNLLKNLSTTTGGSFVPFDNVARLGENLLENNDLKSVIAEENKLEDLIKFQWIFWLLLSLLSVEWFVRKWAGGY